MHNFFTLAIGAQRLLYQYVPFSSITAAPYVGYLGKIQSDPNYSQRAIGGTSLVIHV